MLAAALGRKSHLRRRSAADDDRHIAEEQVIYRQEVLTIMGLIGDLTFAVLRLVEMVEGGGGEEETDED
jgi:hypothetical protein